MTVREIANRMNITVEKVLSLCKKLGINVVDENSILSADDIILIEYELEQANSLNSGSYSYSYTGGYKGTNSSLKRQPVSNKNTSSDELVDNTSSDELVDNTTSDNSTTDGGLNIDPNYLASGSKKLSSYVTSLKDLKSSFSGINLLPGVEDGSMTYCNDYTSQCFDCASHLAKRVNVVKTTLANMDANVALLFDIYDGKFTDQDGGINASDLVNYINSSDVDSSIVYGLLDDAYANGLLNFDNTKDTDLIDNKDLDDEFKDENKDLDNLDKETSDVKSVDKKDKDIKTDEEKDNSVNDVDGILKDKDNSSSSNIQSKNNSSISHRGYTPGNVRENSAEAFKLAGENGFWGCEADVRFDSNGKLVCSHNSVKSGQDPTSLEEYLDICKEYGMTAIIDIKYEKGVGPADPKLSPAILKTIEEKGMLDSCVLQTNNYTDIPYIRENSENARIWYLTDVISDKNLNLIEQNNVECVNILSSEKENLYRINKLTGNGIDVCVWNVQSENYKNVLLKNGATYIMSDNTLGVTPYQDGEEDFNQIVN